jgi:hypothetical protein
LHTKFSSENLNARDHSEDLGIDGKITLGWILQAYGGKLWTGFIWLRTGTSGGVLCEDGNEHSVSIKGGEFVV